MTNVCSSPSFCKEGCQVACRKDNKRISPRLPYGSKRRWTVKLTGCRLSWEVENEDNQQEEVFLLVAKDRNGMIYHLGTTVAMTMEVGEEMMRKAEELIFLSVTSQGLQETHTLRMLKEHKSCREGRQRAIFVSSESEVRRRFPTIPVIILCVSILLLLAALAFLRHVVTSDPLQQHEDIVPTKSVKGMNVIRKKDLLSSTRKEDFGCRLEENQHCAYMSRSIVV